MAVIEQQTADTKWGTRRAITFISKGKFHTVIRRGMRQVPDPTTGLVHETPGLRYEFEPNGTLTVFPGEDVAMDGPVDPETGYRIEADKAGWLRAHGGFNRDYWEIGNEPDAMHPSVEEMFDKIARAAVELDLEVLAELRESEGETHQRTTVLRAIDGAVEAAQAALDQAAAEGKQEAE